MAHACGTIWTMYKSVSNALPSGASVTPVLSRKIWGRLSKKSQQTSLSSSSNPDKKKGFWFLLGAVGARRLPRTLKSVTCPNSMTALMKRRNESVYCGGWQVKTSGAPRFCGLLGIGDWQNTMSQKHQKKKLNFLLLIQNPSFVREVQFLDRAHLPHGSNHQPTQCDRT